MKKILFFVFCSTMATAQVIPMFGDADIFGNTYVHDSLLVDSVVTFPGLAGSGTYVGINANGRLSQTTAAPLADTSHWTQSGTDLFAKTITWDVGIGILNPTVRLEVVGDFLLNNSSWQLLADLALFGPGFPGVILARPQGNYQGITGTMVHPDTRFIAYVGMLNPNTGLTLGVAVDTLNIAVRSNNNLAYVVGNNMTAVINNDFDFTALNDFKITSGNVVGSGDQVALTGDLVNFITQTQFLVFNILATGVSGFDANDSGVNMYFTDDSTGGVDDRIWVVSPAGTNGRYLDVSTVTATDTVNTFNIFSLFNEGGRVTTQQEDSVGKGTSKVGYFFNFEEDGDFTPHTDSSLIQSLGDGSSPWYALHLTTTTSNTSAPPTDAQLDALFGTPATVGEGAEFNVKDSDGVLYKVVAIGSEWYTFTSTLAP